MLIFTILENLLFTIKKIPRIFCSTKYEEKMSFLIQINPVFPIFYILYILDSLQVKGKSVPRFWSNSRDHRMIDYEASQFFSFIPRSSNSRKNGSNIILIPGRTDLIFSNSRKNPSNFFLIPGRTYIIFFYFQEEWIVYSSNSRKNVYNIISGRTHLMFF